MFLLLPDKKIDGGGVSFVAGGVAMRAEMAAFAAFADLEALQRMDQRLSQRRLDVEVQMPRNLQPLPVIALEVIKPLFHAFLLFAPYHERSFGQTIAGRCR